MFYGPNQGGRGKSVVMSFIRDDPDLIFDSAGVEDSLSAVIVTTLADSIGTQEAILTDKWVQITDSVGIEDAPTAITVRIVALFDSVGIEDSPGFVKSASLSDSIGSQDSATALSVRIVALADSFGLQDSVTVLSIRIVALADSVGVRDTLLSNIYRFIAVNADSGAFSNYSFPFAVTGIGSLEGTLYLTTDTGLYALDATDDNGTPIAWEIRGGFSALGSDKLKRVGDVEIVAEGERTDVILVAETGVGRKEYRYGRDYGSSVIPRGRIVKTGRGVMSVLWQVGLYGSGTSRILSAVPRIEPLSRRM